MTTGDRARPWPERPVSGANKSGKHRARRHEHLHLSAHPLKRATHSERGQTTAEYALVLLAAATIAMLAVAWAGTGAIDAFFDGVMDKITSLIE